MAEQTYNTQDQNHMIEGGEETHEVYGDETVMGGDTIAPDEAAAEKKKKKNNLIVYGAIGVIVLGAGGLLVNKFTSKPAPVAKRPAVTAPANATLSVDPAKVAPGAPAPVAPVPGAAMPAAPAVDNFALNPAAQNPAPAPMAQNSAPVAAPVAPAADPFNSAAPMGNAPAPMAMAPAAPAALAPAPAVGVSRGMDAINARLDELGNMFKSFESLNVADRLQKLEDRVGALEKSGVSRSASSANSERAPKVASSASAHSGSRASARRSKAERVDGYLVYPNASSEGSSAEPQVSRGFASMNEASGRAFTLQAVIPGRMWIKTGEGASMNYSIGEMLPDGSKVLRIDPDKGRVHTSNGVLE